MTKIRADHLRLFLLPEVEQRIRHYTDLAGGEVSGLGTVEEFDGGFLVDKVFLPKQSCTPAGTTLDEDAVATLLLELEAAGEDSGRLRFWYHSHAHHEVFWSQTDEECIEGLANGDYVLSLVTNKRGAMLARLDIFRPTRMTVDDIPISVKAIDDDLRDICQAEISDRVAEGNMFGPYHPKLPAGQPLLTHWADQPRDVVDRMDVCRLQYSVGESPDAELLEQQYMEGLISWDEYCMGLEGMGVWE